MAKNLTRLLKLLLFGCFAVYLAFAAFSITYPGALNPYEHTVLCFSRWAAAGHPMYLPEIGKDFPFAHPHYPPLFYYANALLLKIFGGAFTAGRILSFLSTFLTAVFIWGIVRIRSGSVSAAWISAGVFYCFRPVYYWSVLGRVDNMALMLAVGGLWCFFRFEKTKRAWLLCVVFFLAALFTKQTMICAPAALCLGLIASGCWKKSIAVGSLLAVSGIAVLAIANAATRGGFMEHLVGSNSFSPEPAKYAIERIKYFLDEGTPLACFSLVLFVAATGKLLRTEMIFVALASAMGFSFVGYPGADINYFLETCAALAIISGIAFATAENNEGTIKLAAALLALTVVFCMFYKVPRLKQAIWTRPPASIVLGWTNTAMKDIEAKYNESDELLFEDNQIPLLLGWEPKVFSTNEFKNYVERGRYDRDYIAGSIRNKRWKGIVLTGHLTGTSERMGTTWLTDEQLVAIEKNYRPDKTFSSRQNGYTLFVPRE